MLSVTPGRRTEATSPLCPWLDGEIAQCSNMDDESGAAQIAPLELCTKLMEAAVAAGAKLVKGTVEGVETRPGPTQGAPAEVAAVVVDGRPVPADAVVVTMGPWSSIAQDWLGIEVPITGVKSTSVVFRQPERAGPVEPFVLFCGEDDRYGTHLEVYPRKSGEVYVCGVGGSEHVSPDRLRAGEFPPGEVLADPSRVDAAVRAFSEMSNRLGGRTTETQACMRPCAPDALPIMGKVPHLKRAYISAGHNCWGILWAPVSGKAMAELILGRPVCVDLEPFAPGRFMARRGGGRGRKRGAIDVGEQW